MKKSILRIAFDCLVFVACAIVLLLSPLRKLRRGGRTRSLWAGTPILTLPIKAKAERLLGVDARSLVFSEYYITSAFDINLSRWSAVPVLGRLLPLLILVWVALKFDRLHFFCDRGILPPKRLFTFDFRELRLYRALGIDVFLWTYGADVRRQATSRAMGTPNACTDCDAPGRYCICDDGRAAENMRILASLSRCIFSTGDMIEHTPGCRSDLFYWPLDLGTDSGRRYEPAYPDPSRTGPVRVAHAPNHRMFKGTRHLEQAVRELQDEGIPVELVMVEKVPNTKALEIYRSADIIFDQCLIGFHGYFAIEGMALGKPVMSFVRHPDRYLLHPSECPIINTHVDSLKADIRALVSRRRELEQIGRRGRMYVERHYSIAAFSQRLKKTYTDLGVSI